MCGVPDSFVLGDDGDGYHAWNGVGGDGDADGDEGGPGG